MGNWLFGVTVEQLNEASAAHATNHLALAMLLMDKGIITEEEYGLAHARATVLVDQEFARRREEFREEALEALPKSLAKVVRRLG